MTTARYIDENGFMMVKGCPISSFGIFDYGAGQLGLDGDPNRIVKVYRPESAVNNPQTIESFKNVPFIDDHEMLSGFDGDSEASAPEDYGVDGVMTSSVYYDKPWLRGDLKIFSRKMQEALRAGKKDLSLGYSCDFELTPGTFDGQRYEVVQTNLRGNHIALVDEGRVPGARVLDGRKVFDHLSFHVGPSINEDKSMSKKATVRKPSRRAAKDNAVEQLKALLPALEQFLSEEAQEPEHQDEGAIVEPPAEGSEEGHEGVAQHEAVEAAAEGEEGGDDMGSLIAEIEALCAKVKAKLAGGEAEAGDEGEEGEMSGEGAEDEGENKEGEEAKDEEGEEAKDGEEGEMEDNIEGTVAAAAGADEGENGEEHNGKASPGPSAGKHSQAGDAGMKKFYADLARKENTYKRVSAITGAFDAKNMTADGVVSYGIKKLGIKCDPRFQRTALDAYLNAVDAANKRTKSAVADSRVSTADSRVSSSELDAYLNGSK